jgi:proteasome activator subunit 4
MGDTLAPSDASSPTESTTNSTHLGNPHADFDIIVSRATTPTPDTMAQHTPGSKPTPSSTTTSLSLRGKPPGASQTLPPSTDSPEGQDVHRYRPRTFSYMSLLPFEAEAESVRDVALKGILRQLYIAIRSEDFSPGALFWSRQLQSWLQLKFEMPRPLRAQLTKMYYHLALAPGLENTTAERFVSMVIILTRKYHYLKPGIDLTLDWRPIWNQFKMLVFSEESGPHSTGRRKPHKQIWKLLTHSKTYFDPRDRKEMLDEFLPFFSTADSPSAFTVAGLINAFLPTAPAPGGHADAASRPEDFLPSLFHIWSLVARSRMFDTFFIDLFCCMSRDFLKSSDSTFTQYGIFTKEQSDHIFTAILRLTEVPVGQADSPYTSIDYTCGIATVLEKDKKRYPVAYLIARWVVNSLSDRCLEHEESTLSSLEGLIESIETFFHPSNQGGWTSMLGQLTHYLVELFVLRYNREQNGELEVPEGRRITKALKQRFVLCLREVTFMGLFCKSSRVAQYYYGALHGLAYLEPSLILPGALQRFYPSLQGLVEVHRTTSSLNSLQVLANIISKEKGFRCHMTALLALALPGIDANDLGKTQYTLAFIQSVAYSIPMVPLVKDGDGEIHGTSLAMGWVQSEMERMEREGQDVKLDYSTELTEEQEANILKSSTAGFGEFILTLLGKVFTLLENLPDGSHVRSGTPEENVINALPSALGAHLCVLVSGAV